MKIHAFLIFISLILGLAACTPKIQSYFLTRSEVRQQQVAPRESSSTTRFRQADCYNYQAYVPDTAHLDHMPIKYVRVNFHWMNSTDSTKNYTGEKAIEYTYGLLDAINKNLAENHKMFLPHGNDTPVLPTRYRLVLTPRSGDPKDKGIYFHFDDQLSYHIHKGKYANINDRRTIEKYGVALDTVLNIFIMPHHPDSVRSKTYTAYGVGVSLGNAIKAAGMFEMGGPPESFQGIFNHEVGHIFGLGHTWAYNDGCDDTPQNPNCWNWSTDAPCDSAVSNNLMDYNAYQNAWTPCQIGRIQFRMAEENSPQRKFLQPNWCTIHDDEHIHIRDTIVWSGAKDLEGHLTIEPGGMLTIKCRVSLPAFAKITVKPGGMLVLDNDARLHNACGNHWEGIEIQQLGKEKGQVIFIGKPKIEDALHSLN